MNFNLSGHVVLLKLFTHSQSNTEMNSIQIEVALKKYTTVYEFISLGLNSESFFNSSVSILKSVRFLNV